jgi:SagB-type dehydrogenase family enzyme
MKLPEPRPDSAFSLEKALYTRRSVRGYSPDAVSLADVSQLLWAAQGIRDHYGSRTAPSAGATYPLEVYLVAGNVTDLPAGIYKYDCQSHALNLLDRGDRRDELAKTTRGQSFIAEAALCIIITAVSERTLRRYPELGERYIHMEAGHVSQNIYLQAVALGLGALAVGAFDGASVLRLLWLMPHEEPLYIMPVGKPAQGEPD